MLFVMKDRYMNNNETLSPESIILYKSSIKNLINPPCIELNNAIEKYSTEYNIPKKFAYGIAHLESSYNGPFDWNYNHKVTSYMVLKDPCK